MGLPARSTFSTVTIENMAKSTLKTLPEKFAAWLADRGKAEGAQTFDNKPQGFAEEFFAKGDIQVTEAVLEQRLWWWKRATETDSSKVFSGKGGTEDAVQAFRIFTEYHQLSAFYYEFRARHDQRYTWDFGKPWILCSREQWDYLASLWPTKTTPTIWQPSQKGKVEWVEIPARQINLEANDSVLRQQFHDEVARLRKQHGIERPKEGKGKRRKPISFLPIELMDRRYYLGLKLNGSQRSQVSKAQQDYADACKAADIEP